MIPDLLRYGTTVRGAATTTRRGLVSTQRNPSTTQLEPRLKSGKGLARRTTHHDGRRSRDRPKATSSLAFAGNDPRCGPRRSRLAHGRYYGLLHPASLDDNLICRDRRVLYDLLRAISHRAQPPEGA